jgi:DNA-directed RNA polymerase specialized sigma24 family protein
MFRNLQAWQSVYEAEGADADIIVASDREEWSLWDIEALYDRSQLHLPGLERDAIRLCLYDNLSLAEAAEAMGSTKTSEVSAYLTKGLRTLVERYNQRRLPKPSP